MSAWAGFWIGLGLFCLGWGIEDGLTALATALKERGR